MQKIYALLLPRPVVWVDHVLGEIQHRLERLRHTGRNRIMELTEVNSNGGVRTRVMMMQWDNV